MIGDPSGKSEERTLLDEKTLKQNAAGIKAQAKQLFRSDRFKMMNNLDWLASLGVIDFLRDIGKHFSVNAMMQRDSVKARLENREQGISYTEFSYMLLQSYDFLHLHTTERCDLQVGASDQWGNMVSGVDLIRRKTGDTVYAFSFPLLVNRSTGKKFGKTEGGAVWLDPKKTSVYQFYQFWLNVDDAGVIDYAKLYTLLDKEALEELERAHAIDLGQRLAQRTLAREVTTLVHGEARANEVIRVTEVLFGKADFSSLTSDDLTVLAQEIPSVEVGVWVIDALVDKKVASSKGEARRLIGNGAISVNGLKIAEDQQINAPSLIKKGKNSFIVAK